ncbi:MAG: hypothetical protein NTV68_08250 [Methanomicrobiales archaeon]|nr:hypothetical protein [Methanomicrobiales archaeon]
MVRSQSPAGAGQRGARQPASGTTGDPAGAMAARVRDDDLALRLPVADFQPDR